MDGTPLSKIYKGSYFIYSKAKVLKGKIVPDGKYDVGNLVLYDKINQKKIVIDINDKSNRFSIERYTPIAVVVIPQSHDVYGNGKAGAMSLLAMSRVNPDTGLNVVKGIRWGGYGVSPSYVGRFPYVVNIDNTTGELIDGTFGYLPSDKTIGEVCIDDPLVAYSETSNLSPSPYLFDIETNTYNRNPKYYSTEVTVLNALSHFRGKENTEELTSLATAQANWKTDTTIENNTIKNYSPAACCCWRFHTDGTNQGDWYLPACGELGYIPPRFDYIELTISALSIWSGISFTSLKQDIPFWTCLLYDSKYSWTIKLTTGKVEPGLKNNSYCVRPFLRCKFDA